MVLKMSIAEPLKKLVSCVILDLDDGIVSDVLRVYLGKYGKKWDGREAQKIVGKTPLEAATAVVEDFGLSCTSSELLSEINPIFSDKWCNIKALPGANRLIKHLSGHRVPIALASNSPKENIETKISFHQGWKESFLVIIGGDEVTSAKPSPEIFLEAAKRLNIEPSSCLVIEDSLPGVTAGKAAGMQVVAVPSLPKQSHLYTAADEVINSLLDLHPEKWGLPPFKDWIKGTLPTEPWKIGGPVIKGFGRGSKVFGIPTANLSTELYTTLLSEHPSGVYFGWAGLPTRGVFKLVMSIGYDNLHGQFAVTPLDFPVKKTNRDFRCNFLVGSCNGLVCVEVGFHDIMSWNHNHCPTDPKALLLMNHCATDSEAMILWNPCTRDFTVLPNPPVDSKFSNYLYGLGYDYANDDYKVVRGFICYSDGAKEIMIYIFSLKVGSWKTVTDFEYVGLSTWQGLFVNGALHWLSDLPDGSGSSILSFDLGEDEFQKIPLPYNAWFSDPFIHKNCLCVCTRPTGTNTINIWMMKEYGVKESWTQVVQSSLENYVLGPADFREYFRPVCFLENGLVLINTAGHWEHLVVLSNLRDKTFTHFVEVAVNEGLETVIYRETLVSPNVHTYKFNNVS